MSVETRLQELCTLIPSYAQSYYDGEPEISDEEFDALVDELREIDPENEILTSVGWGAKTKTSWGHLEERRHSFHVKGLGKEKSQDIYDMDSYLKGACISTKLDGISAVAYYSQGNLQYVLTRGDGFTGLDISDNLKNCNGLLKTIPDSTISWVRGELVIPKEIAENSNYSNARNMVAGLANSKEVTDYHKHINFLAYSYCSDGVEVIGKEKFEKLEDLCFNTPCYCQLSGDKKYSDIQHWFDYTTFEKAKSYPFLSDGIVVEQGDRIWAIKYPNEVKEVKVTGVEINCSDLGNLIPVICIEPTYIDGVTITRTSGFNFKAIKDAQIGPGAIIKLKQANEVIPHWEGTVKSGDYSEPTEWEGQPTYWKGVNLRVDLDKTKVIIYSLIACKAPKGFARAKILDLITAYSLNTFTDLSELPKGVNNKPLKEVFSPAFISMAEETVRGMAEGWTISEIISSCQIPNVGDVACSMLEEYYTGNERVFYTDVAEGIIPDLDYPTYLVPEGLKNNAKTLSSLLSYIKVRVAKAKSKPSSELIPVCVTGKLSVSRGEFFKKNADKIVEVDIKKAKYLITDNPNSGSSKNKTAQKLGIEILSEEQFYEKFGI